MKKTGDSRDLRQGKNIIMLVVAAVSLLLAIGIGIALPSLTITSFSKVMAVVMLILLVAVAVLLVLLVVLPDMVTPNFFLFDVATGRNLPIESLSDDRVFERVDLFVSRLVKRRSELWLPGKLNACTFGEEGQFAPLVAYKMLIDLGEADSDGAWRCFCAAAPETVKWIADTLQPFEPNMTKDLLAVKARFGTDPAKVRGFVMHNLKYLRARAVQYAVKSIGRFDNVSVQ